MPDIFALLKHYFGHVRFRPGQEQLIRAPLEGRDALGVMPTGAGKSMCYQLPAMALPGIAIVISPLISLMKDQVAALSQLGIPAAYINSSLSPSQCAEVIRRARLGMYRIIYVAPERLISQSFVEFAQSADISLIAVDEAHCVSHWGQDFRPSYLKISEFTACLSARPPVAAYTATATAIVRDDIIKRLALQDPVCVTTGFDRPNLFFEVLRPQSKDACLLDFLKNHHGQSGIIYCSTRKKVDAVCERLRKAGLPAVGYHAGLEDAQRKANQDAFVYDEARIMVATNAFGMGIDKSNVSFVVHYNMPKDMESYYQEAGRAGRDGESAHCLLMFSDSDVRTARFLIENGETNEELSREEREMIRERDMKRLDRMVGYCKSTDCLRRQLLNYFGEECEPCGNCGNCKADLHEIDITVEAQKILSAVTRIEKKYPYGFGMGLIIQMLMGSRASRVMQMGLDSFPTYGIMRDVDRDRIKEYFEQLLREEYLVKSEEYSVIHTTEKAKRVLFGAEKVYFICREKTDAERASRRKKERPGDAGQPAQGLFERLKALRAKLALREKVPAYIVFSNATLSDMAKRRPQTMEQFKLVSGVGEFKASRYGAEFLREIRFWASEHEGG
ncbi:MAG: DNA helicase RecQ [Clostridia bacterium]|nr:DNA helicase RecQ [Clostridia bacterium]